MDPPRTPRVRGTGAGDPSGEPGVLRVTGTCTIRLDELEWRFETSGGRGGQHANRARTRVEVAFNVARSPSLTDRQRRLLRARLGETVTVSAGEERSQARNRAVALDRLRSRLAAALREERPRRPTRPSPASRVRRLASKRRRSELKRTRRQPRGDTEA